MQSLSARVFAVAALAVAVTLAALAAPAAASPAVKHVVVAGDNLWSLSVRYGVPVSVLEARNRLTDSSILALGEVIVIEPASSAVARRGANDHARTAFARKHAARKNVRVAAAHRGSRHVVMSTKKPVTVAAAPAYHAMWIATHTGVAPAPPVPTSIAIAQRIVRVESSVTRYALGWVGVPYEWGGTSYSGVDCSGFVQAVFSRIGIELPRTADSQFEIGHVVKMADLVPGDLVFFETYAAGASHVGIYLGAGRFIHAAMEGVRVDNLSEDYYAARYIGARRLIQ